MLRVSVGSSPNLTWTSGRWVKTPYSAGTNVSRALHSRWRSVATSAIRARWTIDVRYGRKAEAIELLKAWVDTIGRPCGLHWRNTRLNSGSLGAPESRLEVCINI